MNKEWRDLSKEILEGWDKTKRKTLAFTHFILQRHHEHFWIVAAEIVEVWPLGTRLQFHRFCSCGRKQFLLEWWNQFEEPCYE